MSKSRFSVRKGRWNEKDHPRGEDGRFVSDGGGGGDVKQDGEVREQLARAEGSYKQYRKGEIILDQQLAIEDEIDATLRKKGLRLLFDGNGFIAEPYKRKK